MADTYHIIDGQVVPFNGGRKCNNTDAWRDATPLELQLQEQLDEYEHIIAAQTAEIERLREDAARYRWLRKGESDDIAVVRGLGAMDYGMSAVIGTYSEEIDGDDLDAAIDEAMEKENSND